jgi:hypothetical protein
MNKTSKPKTTFPSTVKIRNQGTFKHLTKFVAFTQLQLFNIGACSRLAFDLDT